MEHIFFHCFHTRLIWFISLYTYKPISTGFPNFLLWWEALLAHSKIEHGSSLLLSLTSLCFGIYGRSKIGMFFIKWLLILCLLCPVYSLIFHSYTKVVFLLFLLLVYMLNWLIVMYNFFFLSDSLTL